MNKNANIEILKKAEVKRIGERLTKKELCNVYDISYNFYLNCINGRNNPSVALAETLSYYINTPTADVYKMVFSIREKEEPHNNLNLDKDDIDAILSSLKENKLIEEPLF